MYQDKNWQSLYTLTQDERHKHLDIAFTCGVSKNNHPYIYFRSGATALENRLEQYTEISRFFSPRVIKKEQLFIAKHFVRVYLLRKEQSDG